MGHDHDHKRHLPPGMARRRRCRNRVLWAPPNPDRSSNNSSRGDPTSRSSAPRSTSQRRTDQRRFGRGLSGPPPTSPAPITSISGLRSSTGWRSSTSATRYCPHGQTEVSHNNIRGARARVGVALGIAPVVLGGDHSITWPAATAVADVHGYGNVGIVHFVMRNADTADEIEGNLASHGTPMRRLIESGAVPGLGLVQVGLRGYWPPQDTFEWMLEQKMTWHTMQEIWERGFKDVMRDAVAEALAKATSSTSVYIDVLDPAHAPGTVPPEPGGITSADLLRMVRQPAMSTMSQASTWSRWHPRTTTRNRPSTPRTGRYLRHWPDGRAFVANAAQAKPACALVDLLDQLRLDVPVAQAGMGSDLAGPELAGAVAAAGGLGTLGCPRPTCARRSDRCVTPRPTLGRRRLADASFHRGHVHRGSSRASMWPSSRRDRSVSAEVAFQSMVCCRLVIVGAEQQARLAFVCAPDGVIAQGCGGQRQLAATLPRWSPPTRLPEVAHSRPCLAGGITAAKDAHRVLGSWSPAGVVAGTRFLFKPMKRGRIPELPRRILSGGSSSTTLFRARVRTPAVVSSATPRLAVVSRRRSPPASCRDYRRPQQYLAQLAEQGDHPRRGMPTPSLPMFFPIPPTVGIPSRRSIRRGAVCGSERCCA